MIMIPKNRKKMLLIQILIKKMINNNKVTMIKNKPIQIENEKLMMIVMMRNQQDQKEKKLSIKHKVFNKK
jgi:hypothetical protein